MNPAPATSEYLKSAVLTATPEQLQLMLYDGAIRLALKAGDALRANDREAAFNALDRAQRIALELSNGLNRDANPEIADQMIALHTFVYRRLVEANINQDLGALDDALRILRHQRDTWQIVVDKVRQLHAEGGAPASRASPPPPPTRPPRPGQAGRPESPQPDENSPGFFVAEG